jgi:hypothetical protein
VKLKKTSLEKPKLFQRTAKKRKAPANEAKEGTEKNN